MENMKIPIFFLKGFLMAPHLLVSNVQTTWHGTWGHIFYHILSYSHKSTVLLPLPLCSQAWTGPSSPPVGRPSPSRHWRCLREVFPASSASLRAPFSRLPECPWLPLSSYDIVLSAGWRAPSTLGLLPFLSPFHSKVSWARSNSWCGRRSMDLGHSRNLSVSSKW